MRNLNVVAAARVHAGHKKPARVPSPAQAGYAAAAANSEGARDETIVLRGTS